MSVGGGTIVELKPAFAAGQACFALDNALAFPTDSVRHLIPDRDGCTTTHDDPQGNDETEQVMHLGSGDLMIAGKRVGECSRG